MTIIVVHSLSGFNYLVRYLGPRKRETPSEGEGSTNSLHDPQITTVGGSILSESTVWIYLLSRAHFI